MKMEPTNLPKLVTEKMIIPIDNIIKNFWNPNQMSKQVFESMKETIKQKGLFGSIICRKDGERYQILDGEHRMKACKELGWTELPVECATQEMTNADVQFWTIYFNNTRGKDDIEKRSKILEALDKGQAQLLPFTAEEIENEKKLFKFDFSQYETTDPGIPANTLVKVLSIRFTEEEWKKVEEAISFAKQDSQNEKQWFMITLMKYLDLKRFRSNSVDNLG